MAGGKRSTPARLMVLTALAVFVGEFLVMLLLARLPALEVGIEALLDATLITALVGPFLYLFLFRPMALQMEVRRKAEELLSEANESLERRVEERTAELRRGNELLRLEIEERREVEEKLWKSNEFVRSVLESAPCVVLIYELGRRRCSYVSGRVVDVLGYPPEEVCREDWDFLRHALEDREYSSLVEVGASVAEDADGAIFGGTYRLRKADGEWAEFGVKAVVLSRDTDGVAREILLTAVELELASQSGDDTAGEA